MAPKSTDLARAGIPAQIVSMPLAGAAAPITLLGSVVQHAAECLSGMTIHQLAQPGSPIVWGGAPAIMDMRHGTTPMGAVETPMIDAAYAQVGKSLGFPTHAYMGASDQVLMEQFGWDDPKMPRKYTRRLRKRTYLNYSPVMRVRT